MTRRKDSDGKDQWNDKMRITLDMIFFDIRRVVLVVLLGVYLLIEAPIGEDGFKLLS